MSIRLRRTADAGLVALCAARSVAKEGDVYLDDEVHHALSVKFGLDFAAEGRIASAPYAGTPEAAAIEREESDNANRDWWEREYGRTELPQHNLDAAKRGRASLRTMLHHCGADRAVARSAAL